ncbi:MAG TPA: nitroreductase family deazaflavin-dependent oxidoreductase [Acidimicrobiales bacterium]|nr:nitroreductase family deazaflavin-dependent oxidoreductase [Acidimicrobiales bacterium]
MSQEPGYVQPDLSLVGDEHVRRYMETGGDVGHDWNGVHTLVLTTTGRTSGQPRRNAMIYGRDGASYVVIASQGGMPTHPNWYLNVLAHPDVEVQVGPVRLAVRARTAEGEERDRLWRMMAGIWPNFDVYQTRTDRRIPVLVLEPT